MRTSYEDKAEMIYSFLSYNEYKYFRQIIEHTKLNRCDVDKILRDGRCLGLIERKNVIVNRLREDKPYFNKRINLLAYKKCINTLIYTQVYT